MSEKANRSWDEVLESLRQAASDLRSSIGGRISPEPTDSSDAAQVKRDVLRLEESARELFAKIATALDEQRTEIASSLDRERAERSAGQLKSSLEDLATLAKNLVASLTSATARSVEQAEPELKAASRALEDVAGSAVAWMRNTLDQARDRRVRPGGEGGPPLDDL